MVDGRYRAAAVAASVRHPDATLVANAQKGTSRLRADLEGSLTDARLPMSVIVEKLQRIRSGQPPRYMDLFAGCGGISLGFLTAGFQPVASVELDSHAAQSHGANFGDRYVSGDQPGHHIGRDVNAEDPATIFEELGLKGAEDDQIDVLVDAD